MDSRRRLRMKPCSTRSCFRSPAIFLMEALVCSAATTVVGSRRSRQAELAGRHWTPLRAPFGITTSALGTKSVLQNEKTTYVSCGGCGDVVSRCNLPELFHHQRKSQCGWRNQWHPHPERQRHQYNTVQ